MGPSPVSGSIVILHRECLPKLDAEHVRPPRLSFYLRGLHSSSRRVAPGVSPDPRIHTVVGPKGLRPPGQRRHRTNRADTGPGKRDGFLEGLGSTLPGAREIDQVSAGEIPEQPAEGTG